MPPRGFTNPAPKTDSAREAQKSFFCTLCQKGYSRHPEYAAHLASYDHQHKQRLKDMKALSKDPMAATKARKAEKREDERAGLLKIEVGGGNANAGGSGGGFKKGGFKNAFVQVGGGAEEEAKKEKKVNIFGDEEDGEDSILPKKDGRMEESTSVGVRVVEGAESDTDTEDGDVYYDPRRPTDCFFGCKGVN